MVVVVVAVEARHGSAVAGHGAESCAEGLEPYLGTLTQVD